MTKAELLQILTKGAQLHQNEVGAAKDYRANRTATEYLLTAALMRAAIKECEHVQVEPLCRRVVNVMTSSLSVSQRKAFGKKRFDILIGDFLRPEAIIEVKVGVRSAMKLTGDVDKILGACSQMDRMPCKALGALVFEIDIKGGGKFAYESELDDECTRIASIIRGGLVSHVQTQWPAFGVSIECIARDHSEADFDEKGVIDDEAVGTYLYAAIMTDHYGESPAAAS